MSSMDALQDACNCSVGLSLLHGSVLATNSALKWDKMEDSHITIPEVDIMYTDDCFIIEMNVWSEDMPAKDYKDLNFHSYPLLF